MKQKGIKLLASVAASTYYLGFNMLDPVVGGYTERARKLRQAISIAIDFEEQISIFENGRGIAAQGPLAPGIFGYREGQAGINPYVYDWVNGKPQRKPIEVARERWAIPNVENCRCRPRLLQNDGASSRPFFLSRSGRELGKRFLASAES